MSSRAGYIDNLMYFCIWVKKKRENSTYFGRLKINTLSTGLPVVSEIILFVSSPWNLKK